jgi:pyruvate dehydrogenase E2 component (dihydrolipoamide acetyltransferase)
VPTAALPPHQPTAPTGKLPHASPTIRKLARELGVPLDEVKGSGAKGRIVESDVQGFVKAVMSGSVQTAAQKAVAPAAPAGGTGGGLSVLAWPKVDFEKAPTCIATGSSSRTSPIMTMPTSPTSRLSASS